MDVVHASSSPLALTSRVFLGGRRTALTCSIRRPEGSSWPTRTGARRNPSTPAAPPRRPRRRCPARRNSQVALSRDGKSIVFVRGSTDAAGDLDVSTIATMDLESGRIAELASTAPAGGGRPGWSPDGKHIVFFRFGDKPDGGPVPPVKPGVFVIDASGENMRQVTPPTLAAQYPEWSPDGARIVFVSPIPMVRITPSRSSSGTSTRCCPMAVTCGA